MTKRLKLDGATMAGIFDGTIKTWNASQIKALNPGVTLPSNAIVPEVRADSSGTTYIFTDYLTTAAPTAWTLGASKTIAWPSVAVQTPKNSGVASSIKSTPYSIGYVELAYALQNNFTFAAVKNAAGNYVVPRSRRWPPTPTRRPASRRPNFSIVNAPGAASYPIAGYSWAILLQKQTSATTGARWSRCSTGPPTPAAARTWRPAWTTCPAPRRPEPRPHHAADGDRARAGRRC